MPYTEFSSGINQFLERIESSDIVFFFAPGSKIRSIILHHGAGLAQPKCPVCAVSTHPEARAYNNDDRVVYESVGLDYHESNLIAQAADNNIFNWSNLEIKHIRAALIKACKLG